MLNPLLLVIVMIAALLKVTRPTAIRMLVQEGTTCTCTVPYSAQLHPTTAVLHSGLTVIIIGQEETTTTSDPSTATLLHTSGYRVRQNSLCINQRKETSHVRAKHCRYRYLHGENNHLRIIITVTSNLNPGQDTNNCKP